MLKKLWEKLSQPIIPPAKVSELDTKTNEIAAQAKTGISKIVEGAKAAVAQVQSQVSGPGSTNIQAGGDLIVGSTYRVLGAGGYTFRCRGILCRSVSQYITPLDIMKMQTGPSGFVGDTDMLYYMPNDIHADTLAFARLYTDRNEQIDLEDLPDMRDANYGFGIVATTVNGSGMMNVADI